MAETESERLICKHYNMSYVDVRDNIDLYEYYVLLANSLRAEEREQFNQAKLVNIGVNNPKYLKKWKWNYGDNANSTKITADDPMMSMAAFATSKVGQLEATGNGVEFARATGRPYAFMDASGNLFDDSGTPVAQIPGMVIVKVPSTPQ